MGEQARQFGKDWRRGDPLTAREMNRIERLLGLLSSGGFEGNAIANGAGSFAAPKRTQKRTRAWGKLNSSLSPGGASSFTVWTVDTENGGMDEATDEVLDVVDADLLPETLSTGTNITAVFAHGGWILDGYKCPEEEEEA